VTDEQALISSALMSALAVLPCIRSGEDFAQFDGICNGLAIALALTEGPPVDGSLAAVRDRGMEMMADHAAGLAAEEAEQWLAEQSGR